MTDLVVASPVIFAHSIWLLADRNLSRCVLHQYSQGSTTPTKEEEPSLRLLKRGCRPIPNTGREGPAGVERGGNVGCPPPPLGGVKPGVGPGVGTGVGVGGGTGGVVVGGFTGSAGLTGGGTGGGPPQQLSRYWISDIKNNKLTRSISPSKILFMAVPFSQVN